MCNSHTAKELNLKFNQLYRRQCNLYHTYAAACHLSDTAFSILYCLCETEADEHTTPFTQHELAELCSLPRQTVNSAISGLVKKWICKSGAVSRSRQYQGSIPDRKRDSALPADCNPPD